MLTFIFLNRGIGGSCWGMKFSSRNIWWEFWLGEVRYTGWPLWTIRLGYMRLLFGLVHLQDSWFFYPLHLGYQQPDSTIQTLTVMQLVTPHDLLAIQVFSSNGSPMYPFMFYWLSFSWWDLRLWSSSFNFANLD